MRTVTILRMQQKVEAMSHAHLSDFLAHMRAPCGTLLLKTVRTSSHESVHKLIKVF